MRLGSFLLVFACVGCGAAQSERSAAPVVDVTAPAVDVTTPAEMASAREDEVLEDMARRDGTDRDWSADDNDGDGITNANDKCPDHPETKDGHDDEDGCPETTQALARQTFKDALIAFDKGDLPRARRLFEEAYRILPGDLLLFKLAETTLAQGDRNAACAYYKQWSASPSAQMKPRTIPTLQSCP